MNSWFYNLNNEFKKFLEYSHRSAHEVLTILELIMRLNIFNSDGAKELTKEGEEIRAMLYGFMKKL
ncbi:MAG: hypothetical protein COZ37_06095 [bacterium (Candidatus Ratteibacteria) CG_4_10_14_3_um_filter_41_18]|uniref:Four helix bundle protein n=4 Tax=Candidatus Ratteibacteria TaxID=2979319 RepID=A0A2M7E7X3_9BACT|nr:MAG: hypothetical protein COS11_05530 [bacterium (Candidatus Ratteibacteria) CG01_land_8_20_14_3_00_40_19]PIW33907.1 MAG: hypothetical protein COW28_02060 [bacterium (Candidatus Ratteibacteria) CG15_BIG_FIL_POST_REV_8_21_14_020_41_12]PIW73949.1 MAG: hypothetical protein CO004_03270 [bacterium (Candidatus Ratteibacteria) CG_4_8_14_3_um_filter_41_36]PIX76783.1 MAG: hypothetical protein COZ37_06095 [bacterium (Candidatus Ratteibacteria) CG_4_10_14_3_um_filter_41_18]PJA62389.1 MAG: hypothetical 